MLITSGSLRLHMSAIWKISSLALENFPYVKYLFHPPYRTTVIQCKKQREDVEL